MLRHTLIEHDGESIEGGFPVLNRHGPFFTDVTYGQIIQLDQRIVIRKCASVFRDLAQTHINRLDGPRPPRRVRRINHFANFRRIVEERDDPLPVVPPGLHDRRIVRPPIWSQIQLAADRLPRRLQRYKRCVDQPLPSCVISSSRSLSCSAPYARYTAAPRSWGIPPQWLQESLSDHRRKR